MEFTRRCGGDLRRCFGVMALRLNCTRCTEEQSGNLQGLQIFEEPRCLVFYNPEKSEFEINEEALNDMKIIKHDVESIAIVGPYRTGKSYLLNRLAGKYAGFPLGATVQAKTKGIWGWCCPHPFNSNKTVLLLDTEGIGDVEKGDFNYDNKLLVLTMLICRTFVYNMFNVPDQDVIEKLHSEISKMIKGSNNVCQQLSPTLPELVFALRDFSLELKIDGVDVTTDQYIQYCLKPKPDSENTEINERRNKTRTDLLDSFDGKLHLYTFERPCYGKSTSQLQNLTNEDLDSEFVKDSQIFYSEIFGPRKEESKIKRTDGEAFSVLLQECTRVINGGAVPVSEDKVYSLNLIIGANAVQTSLDLYKTLMRHHIKRDYLTKEFIEIHTTCKGEATAHFMRQEILEDKGGLMNMLSTRILSERTYLEEEYNSLRCAHCKKELEHLYNEGIGKNIKHEKYVVENGLQLYKEDREELYNGYMTSVGRLGSVAVDVWNAFKDRLDREEDVISQFEKEIALANKNKNDERARRIEAESAAGGRAACCLSLYRWRYRRKLSREFKEKQNKCDNEFDELEVRLGDKGEKYREQLESQRKQVLADYSDKIDSNLQNQKRDAHKKIQLEIDNARIQRNRFENEMQVLQESLQVTDGATCARLELAIEEEKCQQRRMERKKELTDREIEDLKLKIYRLK